MKNYYTNLEMQFNKIFRHLKVGSFKTRERYAKAFKRFIVFVVNEYHLQKLINVSDKHIKAYVKHMQEKGLSASTIKTELAAIRFFHDNMPYTRYTLPSNNELQLEKRTFGGVDRTWSMQEFNNMVGIAEMNGHYEYAAIFTLARYAGLRLEECFRIDTNDVQNALITGRLYIKGKGGLPRYVPINESIRIVLKDANDKTERGHKLFVSNDTKTHIAMKRLQCFITYHRKSFTDNKITFHGLRHPYVKLKTKILCRSQYIFFCAEILYFPYNFNTIIGIYIHFVNKHIC